MGSTVWESGKVRGANYQEGGKMSYGFDFEQDGYHFVSEEKEEGNSEITISKVCKLEGHGIIPG